jgi:hypothetical protein
MSYAEVFCSAAIDQLLPPALEWRMMQPDEVSCKQRDSATTHESWVWNSACIWLKLCMLMDSKLCMHIDLKFCMHMDLKLCMHMDLNNCMHMDLKHCMHVVETLHAFCQLGAHEQSMGLFS